MGRETLTLFSNWMLTDDVTSCFFYTVWMWMIVTHALKVAATLPQSRESSWTPQEGLRLPVQSRIHTDWTWVDTFLIWGKRGCFLSAYLGEQFSAAGKRLFLLTRMKQSKSALELIDLSFLSAGEEAAIRQVLLRDEDLKRLESGRVR